MPQTDCKKVEIDGRTYEFYHMSPRTSVKILTRLLKLIGHPMGAAMSAAKGKKSILDVELKTDLLEKIVTGLFDNLEEDMVLDTIETLMGPVMCEGKQVGKAFDTHFQGEIGHLMKVTWEALKANYDDFFDVSSGIVSQARDLRATMSE